jgi:outer membrane protein OmpA-like peptidoglycan-associated protein
LNGMAYGKCCPVAPDTVDGKDNPAGRELNRRVEYKLIRK